MGLLLIFATAPFLPEEDRELFADQNQPNETYPYSYRLFYRDALVIKEKPNKNQDTGKGYVSHQGRGIDFPARAVHVNIAKFQRHDTDSQNNGCPIDF